MNRFFTLLFKEPKFSYLRQAEYERSDAFMLKLVFFHWILVSLGGIFLFHDYYLGPVGGGVLFFISAFAYRHYRGSQLFRSLMAIVLLTYSIILIQQSMGRLEMHFHIFVALSFLIIYRDIKSITGGALFIIVHHLIFNALQEHGLTLLDTPIIIFNYGCGMDIVLLHVFFVIFEWAMLSKMVVRMEEHFMELVRTKEALQSVNTNLESMVTIRTDELAQAKKEAEEANNLKSEFLANMSHEVRTPINAIIGFTNLLEESITTPRHRNYLQSVKSSSKLLLRVINDILDLSKVEAGKMHIELAPTNLHDVAAELYDIFLLKARAKGLDFEVSVEQTLPRALMLDEIRLRQVLINLISNAIKFTPQGYVRVHFKAVPFNAHVNLVICVEDQGIGIPLDQQEEIFLAFTQQKGQMNKEYGGTGLGLTIVKKLLALMDGEIELKSTPGKGSVFTLTLKNVSLSLQKPTEPAETIQAKVVFEPSVILLADDVKSNRTLIKEYLQKMPFKLLEVGNGQEALALLENTPVDLVMMDLKMPVMDGCEAAERIKEQYHIPVIAMTASLVEAEDTQMQKLFDTFLEKPLSPPLLIHTLSRYLKHTVQAPTKSSPPQTSIDVAEIQKYLPECPKLSMALKSAQEDGDMASIESFALLLEACSHEKKIAVFHLISEQLLHAVESFDIENCQLLLGRFTR
ncbi:MAG: response regulator [Campylobacterales bacterium]|nr:response regulator [Campylobacterales bacterium]